MKPYYESGGITIYHGVGAFRVALRAAPTATAEREANRMTLKTGWFDFAVQEPGPPRRRIYSDNNATVIVLHSMVGQRGAYSTMFDPAKSPTAWHGTVAYDGTFYQHYDIFAGLAASSEGNPYGPAFEAEGGFAPYDEPLTTAQVETYLRIIRDMEGAFGRQYRPGVKRVGLTEHNHWGLTACPSGRYQPLYDAIVAGALEDDMADPRVDSILAALGGQAAIDAWNLNGNSLLAGYALEQQKLAEHLANHLGGSAVGTHHHEFSYPADGVTGGPLP